MLYSAQEPDPNSKDRSYNSIININGMSIENSSNTKFVITGARDIIFTNIKLSNTSYNNSNGDYSVFLFEQAANLNINNIISQDHLGSMFIINNIASVNMTDCYFNDLTVSTDLVAQSQSFLELTVDDGFQGQDATIIFDSFNVNVLFTIFLKQNKFIGLYNYQ